MFKVSRASFITSLSLCKYGTYSPLGVMARPNSGTRFLVVPRTKVRPCYESRGMLPPMEYLVSKYPRKTWRDDLRSRMECLLPIMRVNRIGLVSRGLGEWIDKMCRRLVSILKRREYSTMGRTLYWHKTGCCCLPHIVMVVDGLEAGHATLGALAGRKRFRMIQIICNTGWIDK